MDRRGFLRVAGVGALGAALTACTGRSPSGSGPGTTTEPATTSASTSPVAATSTTSGGPPNWAALRAKLNGRLATPDSPGYRAASTPFNLAYADRQPAAVATCTSAADVQACLDVVRSSRIPAAARSGGHSYAGYSSPQGGLVMDLGGMSGIEVRADGTAVIGAGARLMDVYTALAKAGRCLPAGSCPTVGISGLTLGGGIGVLTRKFGLTCDRLTSAQVVTGDGRVVTASEQSEPDLFWALRGGGGGNVGVVTSFEFSTEPAPDLVVFSLRFAAGSAADVFGAWQQWLPAAPPELWSNCVISGGSPANCRVGGCFVGSEDALNPLLDDLVRRSGASVSKRMVQSKGYLATMQYFAGSSAKQGFVGSSRIMSQTVDAPAKLVELVSGRQGLDVLFDGLGGAVGHLAADATAFPHRKALASAQVYYGTTAAGRKAAAGAVTQVQQGLSSLIGSGAYVNYIDPNQQDWAAAYYGSNLGKLKQVARRYDPDRLLAFAQSVSRV